MKLRGFFAELKRRNVYKVAIAYTIVAWLLMQVASQIFPFFDIPSWGVRLVVLLLIIGFPIALILAWAFELTPGGIKITGSSASLVKSIAVLPFANLSRDPDNAYFADGVQEEILTRLAKIGDLKVISRTSTQQYQSKPRNLAQIAKQLGVANILEGSLQRVGEQVRVNVQLVNAQSDSHLWAETYNWKLTDILGVESEIAKGIAESLQAKLSGREEQVIAAKPTDNVEAYDAYLRGLAYSLKSANTTANSLGAQKYLREAVKLDPKFALAWALLSYVDAAGYLATTLQPTIALREEARQTPKLR
jgi:TolB-like protein